MPSPAQSIWVRVVITAPPPGVRFAVQRGKSDLLQPSRTDPQCIQFEFSLRVGTRAKDAGINFLGEFAQGSPDDRFIYINSGTCAGQLDSRWTRRAKLKLASIPGKMVEEALAKPGSAIEASIVGTGADGGPVCASLKLNAFEWKLAE